MYAEFNLNFDEDDYSLIARDYIDKGYALFNDQARDMHFNLKEYINIDGGIDAKKLEEKWFPKQNAHIFLSHSHNDKDKALSLAGYLYKEFGIKCFIDSCVWGYANDLLKEIDDKYCVTHKNTDGSNSYSYERRNQTTGYVHMLLNAALAKMINNTECLMFINTPNSIQAKDSLDDSGDKTASPWIYSEILMATEFPRNPILMHRKDTLEHSDNERKQLFEDLKMLYSINADKLVSINFSDIQRIARYAKKTLYGFLDELYENTCQKLNDNDKF